MWHIRSAIFSAREVSQSNLPAHLAQGYDIYELRRRHHLARDDTDKTINGNDSAADRNSAMPDETIYALLRASNVSERSQFRRRH
uniref:Uncharacterized protein n=1 Tax=Rhizobium leguminosarum TaxID=384 RepID=A0A154IDY9_RHILE|nr:hypothetical protein A4A59_28660 [Rhizobium leguminosarum]